MVHPFSSSLFTPSLFHTGEYDYDLAPRPLHTLTARPEALIMIEADDHVPRFDRSMERNVSALNITDLTLSQSETSRDRLVMSSSDIDQPAQHMPQTSLRPEIWGNGDDAQPLNENPKHEMEPDLGEVGVESEIIVPFEMIPLERLWSISSPPKVDQVDQSDVGAMDVVIVPSDPAIEQHSQSAASIVTDHAVEILASEIAPPQLTSLLVI